MAKKQQNQGLGSYPLYYCFKGQQMVHSSPMMSPMVPPTLMSP